MEMGLSGARYGTLRLPPELGTSSSAPSSHSLLVGRWNHRRPTMNPVVGYAVAVGVRVGTDSPVKYVMRQRQDAEQTAIAQTAGPLAPAL
jgi:hypothetical protein